MPHVPVAVVTGGNRGLGREVCRQLKERGYHVVLTARDPARGRAAAGELGLEYRPLDVTDDGSVTRLADALRAAHPGGLDVVVANAAVALNGFNEHVARTTIDTNYFGVLRVAEALLPQLRPGGRLVLVSSGSGDRALLAPPLRDIVSAPDLTRARLSTFMRKFVADVAAGRHQQAGWPSSAYAVSKIGVTALARVLAREFAHDPRNLKINAVCPGWVRTDMGGPAAERDVGEGAAGIVWAATLGPDGPSGGFFRDGAPATW